MVEQGSHGSDYVLVAAGTGDERAQALVEEMRNAGLRVTYAANANIAARANEAVACVVVLRPDTWKAMTIATVMRCQPDYLLPVLAEPMELPRGPWTREAIRLGSEPGEAEQALIANLRDYLEMLPPASQVTPLAPINFAARSRALRSAQRRRVRPGNWITVLLLVLLLLIGGALTYRALRPQSLSNSIGASLPGQQTTSSYPGHTAKVPGAYCDPSGQWSEGDHYMKATGDSKDKSKETVVVDKYTTTECQDNGLLVTRSGDYDVYSMIYFDGMGLSSLAQHYSVQIDATILSGDSQADVSLDVHIPQDSYGRDSFDINTLGRWEANTDSTKDGTPQHRLTMGFLPDAGRTYTLRAEVDGPVMTFSVNGKKVTTITDTTYPDNSAIAFGITDWSATAPISARFSNFSYQGLVPASLASSQAVATATSQAQANGQKAYSASIPGNGCDLGGGQWAPLADNNTPGQLQCLSNGMKLTAPAHSNRITEEDFYGLDGNLSANYQVSSQIDLGDSPDSCAGIQTRQDNDGNGYLFSICADGSWSIDLITDSFHNLAQGQVQAQSSYKLTAISDGANQSLLLDDQPVQKVDNAQLTTTDHLSLDVGVYISDQEVSATFSNFSFTPLP